MLQEEFDGSTLVTSDGGVDVTKGDGSLATVEAPELLFGEKHTAAQALNLFARQMALTEDLLESSDELVSPCRRVGHRDFLCLLPREIEYHAQSVPGWLCGLGTQGAEERVYHDLAACSAERRRVNMVESSKKMRTTKSR